MMLLLESVPGTAGRPEVIAVLGATGERVSRASGRVSAENRKHFCMSLLFSTSLGPIGLLLATMRSSKPIGSFTIVPNAPILNVQAKHSRIPQVLRRRFQEGPRPGFGSDGATSAGPGTAGAASGCASMCIDSLHLTRGPGRLSQTLSCTSAHLAHVRD